MLPVRASEEGGIRALARVRSEWDHLVSRSAEPTPFLRAEWLRAWWRAFGSGRPRLVLVRDGRELVGGALFSHRLAMLRGVPVRELALASNVHSNRVDLLAQSGREREVGAALARWSCTWRRGWNVLRVGSVPEDSAVLRAFRDELDRLDFPLGAKPAEQPPWIALDGGAETFEASLSAKWKSNLRNREKRIGALGTCVHRIVSGPAADLRSRLDECFALEASGWKGAEGSAIASHPITRRFYRTIAEDAAAAGTLRLHTLDSGGRLVAFQLDLEEHGVEYVLKIGYEPELSKLSPGGLLLRRVIASAIARGLTRVDLLGDDMPWKRDWTDRRRAHQTFLAFGRGLFGRCLHALEFLVVPAAKEILGRETVAGADLLPGTP